MVDNAHRRITTLLFALLTVGEENQLREDQEAYDGATSLTPNMLKMLGANSLLSHRSLTHLNGCCFNILKLDKKINDTLPSLHRGESHQAGTDDDIL